MMFYKMVEHQYTPLGPTKIFEALSHPLRLQIFEYLCHEELTVEDLCKVTPGSYKNMYRQLGVLEQNNLIESYLEGKYRYYVARKESMDTLKAWQEMYTDILDSLSS